MAEKTKEQILKETRAALERDTRVNLHRFPIHIDFSGGDLALEGEVENVAAKKIALEIAASACGIGGIIDRLRVVPAERMGDGEIRDHVCGALIEEPALEGCAVHARLNDRVRTLRESTLGRPSAIEVAVTDGVVLLEGEVPSLSHQRLAGVLAWWVPGSRDVVNCLEVIPPQKDSDEEVTEAVRLALEKDPFIGAAQIRVSTRNYVVTLEGLVVNEKVKEMAESDAWYVFGVDGVVNKLAAEHA